MKLYYLFIIFCLALGSCKLTGTKRASNQVLTGHWLILYPKNQLENEAQEKLFAQLQDSIMRPMGLAMINFTKDNTFYFSDSLFGKKGKWGLTGNTLVIEKAGAGFNYFNGEIVKIEKGIMQVVQQLRLGNENIQLTWHIKKINETSAYFKLFDSSTNWWRHAPAAPENLKDLQKRTSAMCAYYADYFAMIEGAADYFAPRRILMPLNFYQHAIGVKRYDSAHAFTRFYYNSSNAQQANNLLEDGIRGLGPVERGENYVVEYAGILRQLSANIAPGKE
ncbi:MAG: hypothetical protein EAZ16_01515 [Sphingobacteriales bacterium]|nr:MAG: hypothetical protein EAZ16_01515 [Sphingobacteriales bacterium]